MAPKIRYAAAEMQVKANQAAEKEIESVTKEGVVLPRSAEVTSEYLGVLKDDGFSLEAKPTLRSTVGYKWSYRDNKIDVTQGCVQCAGRCCLVQNLKAHRSASEAGDRHLGRDGNPILTGNGEPDTDAQPPFLLRFSPSVFTEEVPYIFNHDPATNTLSLCLLYTSPSPRD